MRVASIDKFAAFGRRFSCWFGGFAGAIALVDWGVATLLAASAVSIGGLIGFVGLVVPHGVRLLLGNEYRFVLPMSAIGGAWVLTFADFLARLGAVELPVGTVTALLGSALLVWLLYRRSTQ
ncbi:iron chelate uptake ABC transporter family permease subunit [Microcoleus sp. ARI1-B5]|uniref:iron chelate uptake ABC transporter family permease subunit n=1 Tax=unclassified Microcoleus TaxID=2642155 RepID=UPI002FD00D1F